MEKFTQNSGLTQLHSLPKLYLFVSYSLIGLMFTGSKEDVTPLLLQYRSSHYTASIFMPTYSFFRLLRVCEETLEKLENRINVHQLRNQTMKSSIAVFILIFQEIKSSCKLYFILLRHCVRTRETFVII